MNINYYEFKLKLKKILIFINILFSQVLTVNYKLKKILISFTTIKIRTRDFFKKDCFYCIVMEEIKIFFNLSMIIIFIRIKKKIVCGVMHIN